MTLTPPPGFVLEQPDPNSPAPPPGFQLERPRVPAPKPEPSSLVRRVVGDSLVDLGKGVVGAGEAAVGVADLLTGGAVGRGLEQTVGFRPQQTREALSELYSPERKEANEAVEQAEGFFDTALAMLQRPSTIAGSAVESAPLMLGGGAIGRGLKAVPGLTSRVARGAIGEGAVGAGSQAEQIRQQSPDGLLSPKQTAAALASGAGTAAIGAVGGKVAKELGIGDPDVALAGGAPVEAASRPGVVRALAQGALTEGLLEEAPQSAQEQVFQNLALERPLTEGVGAAAAQGALTGAAMGAPFGVLARPGAAPTGTQEAPPEAPAEDVTAALRAQVQAARTPEEREAATQALFDHMQAQGRLLPPSGPVAVDAEGGAGTAAQREQRDVRLTQWRDTMGLTPDVNAARAAHPGAVPNVAAARAREPFPDAAPGTLAGAANTIVAAQPPAAAPEVVGVPGNVDRDTGEVQAPRQWSAEEVKQYLAGQLRNGAPGGLPKTDVLARVFGLKPREAAEIRRAVIAEAKAAALQGTADVAAAERPGSAGEDHAARPDVGAVRPASEGAAGAGPAQGEPAGAGDEGGGTPAAAGGAGAAEAVAPAVSPAAEQASSSGLPEVAAPAQASAPTESPDDQSEVAQGVAGVARTSDSSALARAGARATQQGTDQGLDTNPSPHATPAAEPVQGELDTAAHAAATSPQNDLPEPTEAQKEAGNYAKGHHRIAGLDISIENPAGSRRRPEWPPLKDHYGYIRGSVGADKDHVDAFLTKDAEDTSRPVFVVDQVNKDGSFDEHKVVLGAANEAEAREAYLRNYEKGWTGLGAITQMTQDEFKAWVQDPKKTKRPAAPPARVAGPPTDLVAVRTIQGDTVRVRQSDLDSDRAQLRLFTKDGKRKTIQGAGTIHRENLDPDGSKQAAMNAEHMPYLISRPSAKSERDMGFTSERAAENAVKKAGLSLDDYDIRRVPSGYVAVRKKSATTKPPDQESGARRVRAGSLESRALIDAGFAANREAIKDKGLAKGMAVTWTAGERTYTGTILSLGDKEQGVVAVGVPGARGVADYHVPARDLTLADRGAPQGITRTTAPAAPQAAADQPEPVVAPDEDTLHAALVKVSDWVAGELKAGRQISPKALFDRANGEVGGTQAQGAYSPRDAYDALELGVNKAIKAGTLGDMNPASQEQAVTSMDSLRKLLNRLPTQSKRTKEQDEFQQFSTPPTLAFLAARAANLTPADTVLEPSAGTGDLVVMAQAAGARVVANELAPRRAALLRALGVEQVFTENAEQLDNILPDEIRPSVVLMNPPFSATAGRMGQGFRRTAVGAKHVEQALQRLAPGGRLVAIVGEGMAADRPAFRDWWRKIQKEYAVRANIGLSGKAYAKYGTTFDNQLLVIDKTGPTTGVILTEKFDSAEAALPTIEALRNDAPDREAPGVGEDAQRAAAEPARAEAAAEGGREARRRDAVSPATGGARAGERAGRELPESAADAGRTAPDGGDGSGAGVSPADQQRDGGQPDAAVRGAEDAGAGAPVPAGDAGGVTIEAAAEPARASGKLTASIFEQYQPQRLRVPGAQPHPGALVQSAAMAAVDPPAPTYTPNLPKAVVAEGKLSLAQLESVVYAGQAHEQMLPNGERRGYFIGDGTGVGKGREISGILLDNMRQGRGRAVWVSEKPGLLTDAKRDFGGVGGDTSLLTSQSKIKKDAAIEIDRGVLFTTYATLRQGSSVNGKAVKKAGASRVDQLVNWLGDDFDGVIVFDEAHNAGNAISMKGKRGKTKPSAQALAVVDLQKKLPNARVVYVSATGATEVSNLSYATRLGLWGEGTAFPSVESFINDIHQGGLAAMELVSRDMKALGVYTARSLSFDGVTYSRLEHPLTDFQREVYDELARAWQGVLRNIDDALDLTDAAQNPSAKAAAKAQFWGAQQRFFNQVLTAMQTPSVLTQIEADLAAGDAVVLQIVNTYEAAQTRALAEVENEDDLEALDITPRDGLIQYVRNSFPVAQYEEYLDEEGNRRSRPVTNSAGDPVLNKEAVRMRDQLIETLQQIRVPESPLDMILNHFGPDRVAEVTGRKRRVVRIPDRKTGVEKAVVQKRSSTAPAAEAAEFQAGKRDILLFSDAGGTGFSFHADRTAKNQKRRQHYLLQAGWRADKAVQGFGRTHRTNEASQPNYRLVTTDLPAQKRFLSSIARRLDQLGALTKGQRDTANQGLFSAKDNLESQYAQDAVTDFLQSLFRGRIDGMDFAEISRELGFDNLIDKESGGLNVSKLPDVPQFLNRMLSLTVDRQGEVFDQFVQRLEARVEAAIADGTLDTGMQTIDAEKVSKVEEHVLYTDPRSGSQTKAVILELQHKVKLQRFPERAERYVRNVNSHRVWSVRDLPDRTDREGVIQKMVELAGTGSRRIEKAEILAGDKFEEISRDEARSAWEAENAKRPKFETERRMVLTGSLLPIWDRIKGDVKVVRAQTDDGERLIGRLVDRNAEADTLEAFGVGVEAKSVDEIMSAVMDKGETAQLANGWKLKRVRVSGEKRLEVVTSQSYLPNVQSEITRLGGFVERIQWQQRMFLPAGDTDALARLLETRPFKSMVGDEEEGNAIRLSRPSGSPARGMQQNDLAKAVFQWTRGWAGDAPTVVPVATSLDLPERARRGQGWQEAEGYYDEADGAVYLVAANLRDVARAERVLVHEAMGHYGIEAITTPELWEEIAATIRKMRASGRHAELFAEIGRRYVGANDNIFVREAVAVMAEKGVRNSVMDRVIAALRRFLRNVLHLDLRLSEAELRQHIVAAARYVRDGARPRTAQAATEAPAFSRPMSDPNKQVPVVPILDGVFGDVERDLKGTRARAQAYLDRIRTSGRMLGNDETGWKIALSGAGIRELTNFDVGKLNMLLALPRITKVATLGSSNPAPAGERSTRAYHALYAPVLFGKDLRIARLVVREDVNGKFAYDFQRSNVLEQQSPAEAGLGGVAAAGTPAPKAGAKQPRPTAMTVAQIREAVNADGRPGWAMSRPAGNFYSALLEAVGRGQGAPKKADATAWRGWLDGAQRRGEFRQSERDWLGLDDWLARHDGPITREALRDFVEANQVQVQDVVLDEKAVDELSRELDMWLGDNMDEDMTGGVDFARASDILNDLADEEARSNRPTASSRYRRMANEAGELADGKRRTPPKFASYQLPGGQNYRELLLTLPVEDDRGTSFTLRNPETGGRVGAFDSEAEADAFRDSRADLRRHEIVGEPAQSRPTQFRSSHFDQPNILAHVRFNERTDADGKRVLFLEEIQSDWHQAGRKRGYGDRTELERRRREAEARVEQLEEQRTAVLRRANALPDGPEFEAAIDEAERIKREIGEAQDAARALRQQNAFDLVPDAPFKATDEWAMLAFKRMVRWAAENGFDRIAWTTGAQQAERYDLSKQVDEITVGIRNDGRVVMIESGNDTIERVLVGDDGVIRESRRGHKGKGLDELVGKEIADKIMARREPMRLRGNDLKIGGEGMRAFYDSILPKAVNKWAKRFGGKVEPISVNNGEFNLSDDDIIAGSVEVHGLDLTDSMRDAALQGQPLFSRPDTAAAPASLADALGTALNSARDVKLPAGYLLGDLMGGAGGLHWWHKTVGTQFNLAERFPEFRRVFNSVQQFVDDVSYFATEAADEAPRLLPKLEGWKDVFKQPVSAADTKAIAAPIFEGTLSWKRAEDGSVVPAETVEEAGIVWTDDELRDRYKLSDGQIELYREFRAATDKSLTNLFISQMVNHAGDDVAEVRQQAVNAASVDEVTRLLAKHLGGKAKAAREAVAELQAEADRVDAELASSVRQDIAGKLRQADSLEAEVAWLEEQADRFRSLRDRGYAPLSRFGRHSVYVTDADGEQVFFGLYDTAREANRAARQWEQQGHQVERGTMSEESWRLFQGITPETLELFGDMLGLSSNPGSATDEAFQQFLRLTKNNRSAMKRLIHRKGVAGFSEDVGRVLAGFIYSNARLTSATLHNGETQQAVAAIPRDKGELKDAAVKLADYVRNPQEEAHALRAFTFAQYLGGSIAAAMVNMTQTITMTFPYLSQYGGAVKAAAELKTAVRDALRRTTGDPVLDAAIRRGEEAGLLAPQEIHQLMAQARGAATLQSGDDTPAGRFWATTHNALAKTGLAWGKVFSVAEAFNRRTAFIAAYRMAQAQGIRDAEAFATNAVQQTQGVYSKANKPRWARGAIGSTLFTFKQFSVSYVELLHRMATRGGPEGRRATLLALGVMFLMSGAGGLPGADDLDDLIDGVLQRLGYNFTSKQARFDFFASMFGRGGAQFLERGISGLPGVPIDVAGRLGMGNLVPGTGLLRKKSDHSRDLTELVGPVGDLATRAGQSVEALASGRIDEALLTISPVAIRNLFQGVDMATTGMYRDSRGRKVLDVNGYEALSKAIGYQPASVARVQHAAFETQQMIAFAKMTESEIASMWAQGLFEQDPSKVREAKERLAAWNRKNPTTRIRIKPAQIRSRLRAMRLDKRQRLEKTAPAEIRSVVREALAD